MSELKRSTLQKKCSKPLQTTTTLRKPGGISGSCKLTSSSGGLVTHARDGSTRRVGDIAEAHVAHTLEKGGIETKATRNSGAMSCDGDLCIKMSDVDGDYIRAECKHRNTEGFTINKDHWNEIKSKAIKHGGVPALITSNSNGEALITMDLTHFTTILGERKG